MASPPRAHRRRLRIYALDPLHTAYGQQTLTIDVPNEPLAPGPVGQHLAVVDYDGVRKRYFQPVDLEDPELLKSDGLEPSESNPQFHQQMVYAVTMKAIEVFEKSLGRPFAGFGRFFHTDARQSVRRLQLVPHAFRGANAFYDPTHHAVMYGFFRVGKEQHGFNMPGQDIYSCLSHDIIAHESAHALVHRVREYYLYPTNHDVLAFHEAFSDLVALFLHFSYPEIVRLALRRTKGNLRQANLLMHLAEQFGQAIGSQSALRSAINLQPDPARIGSIFEPHDRGAILVAAVMHGFIETYQRRIEPLLLLATDGSGILPDGELRPQFLDVIAVEVAKVAEHFLTMIVRALDYMPPVDPTFGDFLRAMVTADLEIVPIDKDRQRLATIHGFRTYGIFPSEVHSLSEESLRWKRATEFNPLHFEALKFRFEKTPGTTWEENDLQDYLLLAFQANQPELKDFDWGEGIRTRYRAAQKQVAIELHKYATRNAQILGLVPDGGKAFPLRVAGFHPVFRTGPTGTLEIELIAQFVQTQKSEPTTDTGGLEFRGGATVIFKSDGRANYVVSKPLQGDTAHLGGTTNAAQRQERQSAFLAACDDRDSTLPWRDAKWVATRGLRRATFAALHRGGLE